jgi:hypothetical protein
MKEGLTLRLLILLALFGGLFLVLRNRRTTPDNSRAITTAAQEAEVRGAEAAAAQYRRAE